MMFEETETLIGLILLALLAINYTYGIFCALFYIAISVWDDFHPIRLGR